MGQWVHMAMEYKIVIPPDMGSTDVTCKQLPSNQNLISKYLANYTSIRKSIYYYTSYGCLRSQAQVKVYVY